jgi:hypothetical protein
MAQQRTRIHYPIKGISEHFGYSVQEEMTCRDDRNVRSRDPRTGRIRGAQRAGMGLYAGGGQLNGSNRVLALGAVSSALPKLNFTDDLSGTEEWDNANKSFGDIVDMIRGPYESYVAVTSNNKVYVFNEDGGVLHEIDVPLPSNTNIYPSCVAMDEYQNIFVGTTAHVDPTTSPSTYTQNYFYIFRYNEDDTYTRVFTLRPTFPGISGFSAQQGCILDIKAANDNIYVLVCEPPAHKSSFGDERRYWRLNVYNGYLPFNEAPVEDDNLAYQSWITLGLATASASLKGNDYWYLRNTQTVGRLSVKGDRVLVSVASMNGTKQEASNLRLLHVNENVDETQFLGNAFQNDLGNTVQGVGYLGSAVDYTGGFGLDAQWLDDAVPNEDAILSCGGPFEFKDVTLTSTPPSQGVSFDYLRIIGTGKDGSVCTLQFHWKDGSGSGPALVSYDAINRNIIIGICGTAPGDLGATAQDRADQLIAARNFAETLTSPAGIENHIVQSNIVYVGTSGSHETIRISSSDATKSTATVGTSEHSIYVTDNAAWATPDGTIEWDGGTNVRRILAKNDSSGKYFEAAAANTYTQSFEGEWGYATPQSAIIRFGQDQNNNAYIPWGRASGLAAYDNKAVVFFPAEYDPADQKQFTCTGYTAYVAAAMPPLDVPDYYDDATILHAPFVLIGGPREAPGAGQPSIWRFNLVSASNAVGSPRDLHVIGVSGNKVVKVLDSSIGNPDNNAVISSTAQYVQIASGYQKCYIADGINYWVYDPLDTDASAYGSVKRLACTSVGNIPPRCKLVEMWHGRLVLARDPADPGRWSMSAINDPNNWDYFPQIPSALQACSSTNTRAGRVPDIINTMVVYSDDLLLFGGDRTIWQLTGDPMAGGSLDLITDETGMAFGRPYCKDPQGTLWFFGSTGGLFYMVPGQRPQRASVNRVEKSLRSIDLGTNYVQLQWNPIDEGVHIFVIPFGTPSGTLVDHWFYEVSTDAWHKDRFGLADGDNIQPCAAVRMDGDLYNDRTLLIGGEDGRVRRWGVDASGNIPRHDEQTSSTNIGIDSYALFGPLIQAPIAAAQLTEASFVLASDQHGVNYEFFAESTPDDLGDPVKRGRLRAGRNDRQLVRVSGDHVYMRLRNSLPDQSWAYEAGDAEIASAGSTRR